ncbi:hypothetical protein CA85_02600 [Allorhodopirellula solitaria]|uniref:Leucine Rich repeats (2 copies) n=2 Tax=Allorhodopirellula solitaria TaxID=2527987 RepID=A0A5C5YJC5_9BACT|nr:hypothetical protein CA85_02600 [Allorhodopirellula solitaria]
MLDLANHLFHRKSSATPRVFTIYRMSPRDAAARIAELGSFVDPVDFSKVEHLHICEREIPANFADMVAGMAPETVTLNGALMTASDIAALLHFPSLRGIVAHHMDFASTLLPAIVKSSDLRSIAMSHTSITDTDVTVLANRSGLTSIHFAGTRLTDIAMTTFGTLPDLELLDVSDTHVTNDGLHQLRDLRNLFTINARGTSVTADGANGFRRLVANSLPDVEVLV